MPGATAQTLKTLLLIMNPRKIGECVASLEPLPVDQAWMTGYREEDLPINHIVAHTDYDRYSIVSDDAIGDPDALARVLAAHDNAPDAVVTGYSRLADDDERVNLVDRPIADVEPGEYGLLTQGEVDAMPPVFETWFAGYSFTTASRDAWLDCPHPLRTASNDFYQSRLFTGSGRRILAVRDAKIGHVKERYNQSDQDPRKQSWVGFVPAEVRWRFQ